MINQMVLLGEWGIENLRQLGKAGMLMSRVLFYPPNVRKGFPLVVQQVYAEGVLSLLIIIVSGLFIGMVLALQGYHTLTKFGASQELGPLVALSVSRELGPVVTAILFAGRAGSALTAEIALMKATEQLSSMEMMAVDPLRRIISPRFWGGFISMPLLTMIFNAVAIYGAYLVGVKWLGVDAGVFWSNMQSSVEFHADIVNGILKSVVFGAAVTWIAVAQGYFAVPTSAGIASATTRSVVYGSLAVLGLDFILTAMMIGELVMLPQRRIESLVGFFLLLAFIALSVLAFKVSGLTGLFPEKSYTVIAAFDDIGGLKVRSPVKISGVQIGEVDQILLDPVTFKAVVKLRIYAQYNDIPDDSSAGIFTAGLLGDNYIAITPMYSQTVLKDGSKLQMTHSAMILEKLIGQFIYKMSNSDNASANSNASGNANDNHSENMHTNGDKNAKQQ